MKVINMALKITNTTKAMLSKVDMNSLIGDKVIDFYGIMSTTK
ncbi:hypothetical protein [Caldicellulosiruptor changbaiensis]|nr:hypothetical protein [Caldicellulosiruptor changbaiensis]